MKRKRRERSHMNKEDCFAAFESFAKRVVRMGESSDGHMFGNPTPHNQINICIRANGNFGAGSDLFEAIRVLAEHKLPNKN